jgi:translocation and assembly module TamA
VQEPGPANPSRCRALAWHFPFLWFLGGLVGGCSHQPHIGPQIHKIRFLGVKQVKLNDLRGKLSVQESSWFPFAPKHYLETPFTVEVDSDRIEAYYRAHGYFAAKVQSAKTQPSRDEKQVDITFTIREGEPTRVRTLTVQGLDALGEKREKGLAKLTLGAGKVFDHDQYLLSKERLLHFLREQGYAFAQVSGEVDVDRDKRTADITLRAETGPVVHLGVAHVTGTQNISAPAVEKHAAVNTGDVYKPETLDAVQGSLYSLGVFSTVKVEPVARPDNPAIADVHIAVSEGKPRELRLGGGISIEPARNDVHAEIGFTQRRFLGGLRTLQAVFRPGYAVMPALWTPDTGGGRRNDPIFNLKTDFTQPDLLGANSALTVGLGYDLGLEYAYQYHGPSASVGIQRALWKNHIKLAAAYNFQFLQFFNQVVTDQSTGEAVGSLFGYTNPYQLGYLQEQVVLDLRNRALDATRGFLLGIASEQSGVYTGSAFSYQKILPEARAYVSLGHDDRITFAARVVYGQIWVQGETGSPITQRLFLGGPGSHRGFSYNRLSYQVCTGSPDPIHNPNLVTTIPCPAATDPQPTNFNRIPIGGDQMVLGQVEARLKLFKIAGNWLSIVAFADAGDVAAPRQSCKPGAVCSVPYSSTIDLTKLHLAVGGGLRYRTVIGTVRFDLGVRLNRLAVREGDIENPDPGQQFVPHISIGEAF